MSFKVYLRFLFAIFILPAFLYGLEAKIVAVVNDKPISSIDVENHQEIIKHLNGGLQITKQQALEDIIRQYTYIDYAQKAEITPDNSKIDFAMDRLKKQNLNTDLSYSLFEDYIKTEILIIYVIEKLVRQNLLISEKDIFEEKERILAHNTASDYKKLEQIFADKTTKDMGWVYINDLSDDIKKQIESLKVGQTSKDLNGMKFKILDEGNHLILSASFKLENNNGQTLNIKLSDIKKAERNKLKLSNTGDKIQISISNSKPEEYKVIESEIEKMAELSAYRKKLDKQTEEFTKMVISNSTIIKK